MVSRASRCRTDRIGRLLDDDLTDVERAEMIAPPRRLRIMPAPARSDRGRGPLVGRPPPVRPRGDGRRARVCRTAVG